MSVLNFDSGFESPEHHRIMLSITMLIMIVPIRRLQIFHKESSKILLSSIAFVADGVSLGTYLTTSIRAPSYY